MPDRPGGRVIDDELLRKVGHHVQDQMVVVEAVRGPAGEVTGWRYLDANASALELLGRSREALLGRSLAEVLGERAPAAAARLERVLASGQRERYEASYAGRDFLIHLVPAGGDAVASTALEVTEARRAERALRDSEQRYAAMFQWSPLAKAWTRLPEGTIVEVNDAWIQLTGIPREEAVGRTSDELGLVDAALRRGHYDTVAAQGASEGELTFHTRTRGDRTIHVHGNLVTLSGERFLLAAMQDVTEARRAAAALGESEARFRAMADGTPLMIWCTDPEGRVEFVNRAYCEFFGTTQEAVTAGGWQTLVHPDDAPRYVGAFTEALARRSAFHAEARVRRADGAWRWVESFGQPRLTARGEFLGITGSSPDVTDRKRSEDELREAARRKDEFLAVLSHELRNPLAPIRNAAYVLEHADPAGEQAERARGVLRRQSEHLTRLVDDLLDVTRITRGRIALQRSRFDLREAVARAAEDFRPRLAERGVALRMVAPSSPLWVNADPTRVNQVFANLLHNASKFTRSGDEVVLGLARAERFAEVRVQDTGAGIDPRLLPSLFEPFVQGERTLARSEGGLGLGLALVKGIVELHDGEVRAESAGVGQGSRFTVRLPLAAEAVAEAAAPGGPRAAGGTRRVLVVDDNQDAGESLAELLRLLGHEADVVYDGEAALRQLGARAPDVVFCDIGLPGMDGYELARRIRLRGGGRVRLVAVSGYAQAEDVGRALAAGFDAHVAKPPNPEQLDRLLA